MIELVPSDMANGGEAVARLYGKAHFIAGALPGERVTGTVTVDKGAWARVDLTGVLDPSPDRVEPPCPHFSACGGCQWQYASHDAQLAWKRGIVTGQLAHLGKLADPPVRPTLAASAPFGYRNRMDFVVLDGRPGLHHRRSRQIEPLSECLLLHPLLQEVFDRLGALDGVDRLTLRCGVNTGDRLVVIDGAVPAAAPTWGTSVAVRDGTRFEAIIGDAHIHETVGKATMRISGTAFFQSSTDGAAVLATTAADALSAGPDDTVLDAYAGGGLFSLTAAAAAGRVVAVEVAHPALSDLRHNLTGRADDFRVVSGKVEDVVPTLGEPWQLAVVNPPRTGLGAGGVAAVSASDPRTIVYVSCDPASLARDARYLADRGYGLEWAQPVDMFPQTFHVETVAKFIRQDGS